MWGGKGAEDGLDNTADVNRPKAIGSELVPCAFLSSSPLLPRFACVPVTKGPEAR